MSTFYYARSLHTAGLKIKEFLFIVVLYKKKCKCDACVVF